MVVSCDEFRLAVVTATDSEGSRFRNNITPLKTYTNHLCVLASDYLSGYAISASGELVSVFSRQKREGRDLVKDAIRRGAIKLNCFENLKRFYELAGFSEIAREKNWICGEPDVVFMEAKI